MKIADMVRDNKKVNFSHYRDGSLWYVTESGFEFPVPVIDIGNATFLAQDKALLFMRYIRAHLEMLQAAKIENGRVFSENGTVIGEQG